MERYLSSTRLMRQLFLEITPADIENRSISDILEFKTRETGKDQADQPSTRETVTTSLNEPKFWYWSPAHLNERITAQHSLFLFGPPSSMELRLKPEEIVIESANKGQIRRELKELHDIHEESLFPDFVGFAYTQRHNAPYSILGGREYYRRGVEELQRGQYSEAVEYYTKALELRPDYLDAYALRGLAYRNLGKYDEAVQDCTKALELRQEPWIYALRGLAYRNLGKYDEVVQGLYQSARTQARLPRDILPSRIYLVTLERVGKSQIRPDHRQGQGTGHR